MTTRSRERLGTNARHLVETTYDWEVLADDLLKQVKAASESMTMHHVRDTLTGATHTTDRSGYPGRACHVQTPARVGRAGVESRRDWTSSAV